MDEEEYEIFKPYLAPVASALVGSVMTCIAILICRTVRNCMKENSKKYKEVKEKVGEIADAVDETKNAIHELSSATDGIMNNTIVALATSSTETNEIPPREDEIYPPIKFHASTGDTSQNPESDQSDKVHLTGSAALETGVSI